MKQKYNVLIIGAGNIGAFFDTPDSEDVLTHAHAFTKHKGFNLAGFVDLDMKKAKKAVLVWGGRAFKNAEEALAKERMDIVCIAVPDDCHYSVLKNISQANTKFVFAEKPLAANMAEADEIVKLYQRKKIPLAVNYSRRFIPEFQKIKWDINKGLYGDYITGTGYYGKGILHNGSHLINLLIYLIGGIEGSRQIDRFFDFTKDDPSISAVLDFGNDKNFLLQYIDSNLYTIFEIDLFFKKKRISIKDLGCRIEEYDVKEGQFVKGYKNMVQIREIITSCKKSLYYSAENIYNYLTKGEEIKCTINDAYKTMQTCIRIRGNLKD